MTHDMLLKNILQLQEPDGAFASRADGKGGAGARIIEANHAICKMLGYTREELITLAPADIIPTLPEQIFGTGGETVEHSLTTKRGNKVPVAIRSRTLTMEAAVLDVFMIRDITHRKERERKASLDEQRFKLLYSLSQQLDQTEQDILQFALDHGVTMTGSQIGYICLMNEAETELTLQACTAGILGQYGACNRPASFKASETGLWGEAIRQRKPIITNDYATSPDKRGCPEGHVLIKRHMNLPILENGHITLVAGVGNKEEEYTEADVVQLSLIMEGVSRIIERKRMETDLIKAMKTAENANRAKSQFLANMSHELRTPLNGIMGMTQILLGTEITDEQKEYLTLSLEASMHLSKVMTSLLDLSSIESGGITLTPMNFNLPDTIESVIKPLVIQAEQKNLRLTCDVDGNVPVEVNGDVDKFRQILINLVFNAIKFTEEGHVSIKVSRTSTTTGLFGDMAEIRFIVTDSGIGIHEDKQEAIFESFMLGEDYLTKRYGGMGLGLSISRELTTLMGGGITLKSQPNRGSTFTLTLPFLLRDAKGGSCVIADTSADNDARPLNILVAEDEQVNALVTSRILKKNGHHATVVGNGQHAIDALIQGQYDLVLMDVQMPVINGLQVTEIIRSGAADGIRSDTPIIGLTAFAGKNDRQRFLEAGMDDVVTKPFEATDLLCTIRRILAG
ncbi:MULTISPECIES: ATP-binding protein [unclassified Pseudodesulfovibrio]|uniref:ATP-binding protein n=1 Tax=unclassified Pseudodesulfovibrio TaxID=2661612 RepID=UPI001007F669|nr:MULTISPECIES: ATP-binding protein [unclassified Pseudodesulfovibrio]MCJ2165895.1 ATP-binding protein [Pseudodesulfovibrio sp. S3-i]RWU02672.1 response regulator [Pseudodesulfovibrio sp. S3]